MRRGLRSCIRRRAGADHHPGALRPHGATGGRRSCRAGAVGRAAGRRATWQPATGASQRPGGSCHRAALRGSRPIIASHDESVLLAVIDGALGLAAAVAEGLVLAVLPRMSRGCTPFTSTRGCCCTRWRRRWHGLVVGLRRCRRAREPVDTLKVGDGNDEPLGRLRARCGARRLRCRGAGWRARACWCAALPFTAVDPGFKPLAVVAQLKVVNPPGFKPLRLAWPSCGGGGATVVRELPTGGVQLLELHPGRRPEPPPGNPWWQTPAGWTGLLHHAGIAVEGRVLEARTPGPPQVRSSTRPSPAVLAAGKALGHHIGTSGTCGSWAWWPTHAALRSGRLRGGGAAGWIARPNRGVPAQRGVAWPIAVRAVGRSPRSDRPGARCARPQPDAISPRCAPTAIDQSGSPATVMFCWAPSPPGHGAGGAGHLRCHPSPSPSVPEIACGGLGANAGDVRAMVGCRGCGCAARPGGGYSLPALAPALLASQLFGSRRRPGYLRRPAEVILTGPWRPLGPRCGARVDRGRATPDRRHLSTTNARHTSLASFARSLEHR